MLWQVHWYKIVMIRNDYFIGFGTWKKLITWKTIDEYFTWVGNMLGDMRRITDNILTFNLASALLNNVFEASNMPRRVQANGIVGVIFGDATRH